MSPLSDDDFDALEDRVERIAAQQQAPAESDDQRPGKRHRFDPVHDERDFEELVSSALDELPPEVQRELEGVAVVVSDDGAKYHAYGQYRGIQVKNHRNEFLVPGAPDQILIFRDTLVRDFGHDPKLLRAQVTETVRHEVAHHIGFDEDGVARLGL